MKRVLPLLLAVACTTEPEKTSNTPPEPATEPDPVPPVDPGPADPLPPDPLVGKSTQLSLVIRAFRSGFVASARAISTTLLYSSPSADPRAATHADTDGSPSSPIARALQGGRSTAPLNRCRKRPKCSGT